MVIPEFVTHDLNLVRRVLGPVVRHYGLFGSILRKSISEARDVDVLWVYSGTTFESICEATEELRLNLPFIRTYMNYSFRIAVPPEDGKYYHFVFMPKDKPNRKFLRVNEGGIYYLTEPFVSWRESPLVVA